MVRVTYGLDMTIAVDFDVKPQTEQTNYWLDSFVSDKDFFFIFLFTNLAFHFEPLALINGLNYQAVFSVFGTKN